MKIGFTEILLILAVALLVLGPDKFPYYMKKLGNAVKELKKYTGELTEDIKENVIAPLDEAQKPLREAMAPFEELDQSIKANVKDVENSIKGIGKPEKKDEKKEIVEVTEEVAEVATEETTEITSEAVTEVIEEVSGEETITKKENTSNQD